MPNPLAVTSSLLLFALAPAAAPAGAPDWGVAMATLQQQEHVTIAVPRVTITSSTTIIVRNPARIVEKKAKDCVKAQDIAGFAGINTTQSVDLVLRDGSILRAKLGRDCQALNFYSGAYVKMNKDQKICAGRDAIRTRAGRSCDIDAFRRLELAR